MSLGLGLSNRDTSSPAYRMSRAEEKRHDAAMDAIYKEAKERGVMDLIQRLLAEQRRG